jgi:hypothetical protein
MNFLKNCLFSRHCAALLCLYVLAAGSYAAENTGGDTFHDSLDAVLRQNVSDGIVNYPGIAADPRFDAYIESLRAPLPAGLSAGEELVFWINAYNALSIQGILDSHSPKSLWGRLKFFKRIDYEVGGKNIDLFDLERKVIIPLGEPRIHFAIVCASLSCPPLRSEAYTVAQLDNQLDDQARLFLNDAEKNSFDEDAKVAYISKIFDWYEDEFANHAGSVQLYIAQFIVDPNIVSLLRTEGYRIKYEKYDWSLNGQPPK